MLRPRDGSRSGDRDEHSQCRAAKPRRQGALDPPPRRCTLPLRLPPPQNGVRRRAGFFPGSTIGNFTPAEALAFLRNAAALLAGGALFGFVGVLLAVPLAAILKILLRVALEAYRGSSFYRAARG